MRASPEGELPGLVAAGEAELFGEGGDARRGGEEEAFEGAVVRGGGGVEGVGHAALEPADAGGDGGPSRRVFVFAQPLLRMSGQGEVSFFEAGEGGGFVLFGVRRLAAFLF
ncbi:MAG TPA: hypothetical protein VGB79_14115 [Allosphingosinicella sp.]|jgi:hypothetical protein